MSKKQTASSTSIRHRREFLKTFGAVVGGLAMSPLSLTSSQARLAGSRDLPVLTSLPTIGLLLPPSTNHPRMGDNFVAGMNVCFDRMSERTECGTARLLIREVEPSRIAMARTARLLLTNQKPDFLVAMTGPNTAIELHDDIESHRTFLILADAGANIVRSDEHSPYVFHNTLTYWRSSWALGEWAVKNYGRKVFIASSLYESGYDAPYTFRLGAERAGGNILRSHVSHNPPGQSDLTELMTTIKNARPDSVHALYSGNDAIEFMKAYIDTGLARQIPLTASSFMLDESLLNEIGTGALGIQSCSSWSPTLDTPENKDFTAAYARTTGRVADEFAILGYDTARLIVEAISAAGSGKSDSMHLRNALRSVSFNGPRGTVVMDPQTQTTAAPLHLREVRRTGNKLVNAALDELKPGPESHHTVAALRGEIRTGWINPYLSV